MRAYYSAYSRLYMSSDNRDNNSESGETDNEELLPKANNVIRGEKDSYAIGKKLAPGRHGAVFEVLRRKDGKRFAAKLEIIDSGFNGIHVDYMVLKLAQKKEMKRIPQLIDRGKIENHFKFIVMEKLDDNLHDLRNQFVESRFSATTVLKLALETLECIEELHGKNLIHRDIKPSNFALKRDHDVKIYIIDFGLCKKVKGTTDVEGSEEHPKESTHFNGTPRYASLTAHNYREQTQKDDIESWMYMLIEMLNGGLPWNIYSHKDREIIKEMKESHRHGPLLKELLKNCPQQQFAVIFNYLDSLPPTTPLDHSFIRAQILEAITSNGLNIIEPYDWEEAIQKQ
uniref:Protein kinase domain-containing protein n=1 Tax=Rhabditophanes sp. KR3021 TaxID=114890 RepID=A0AC35TR19_9BILA